MSSPRGCDVLARRLRTHGDAGGEDLVRAAREEAAHIDGCRDCREELALRDPAALFSLLAFETKDDAFFTGFETRVMAGIRQSEREERGGWLGAILRPRLLVLYGSAAAIAVVLVVGMGRTRPPQTERVVPPPDPAVARAEGDASAAGPAPLDRRVAASSPVSVTSATARVISIKVEEPQQEPFDLVLIVDPEMPL